VPALLTFFSSKLSNIIQYDLSGFGEIDRLFGGRTNLDRRRRRTNRLVVCFPGVIRNLDVSYHGNSKPSLCRCLLSPQGALRLAGEGETAGFNRLQNGGKKCP